MAEVYSVTFLCVCDELDVDSMLARDQKVNNANSKGTERQIR